MQVLMAAHPGLLRALQPHLRVRQGAAEDGEAAQVQGQTVVEAQQGGELVQLRDDASYALDGLSPGSTLSTQRDSAAALCETLSTRKGRLALRKDGLAQQVLSSLAKVKVGRDPVLALAASCALLAMAQEDAHPAYMASTAAAVLAEQLLQERHDTQHAANSCPAGARLQRLLKNGTLVRLPQNGAAAGASISGWNASQGSGRGSQQQRTADALQKQQQQQQQQQQSAAQARAGALTRTPQGVLMLALAQATGANDAGRLQYTEIIRGKMLRHGLLEKLAGLMWSLVCAGGGKDARRGCSQQDSQEQEQQQQQGGNGHVDEAAVSENAWLLSSVLVVLENATFTSPENAACLADVRVDGPGAGKGGGGGSGSAGRGGGSDGGGAVRLPSLLVKLLPPLCAASLSGHEAASQCLHGCLALLMNLTHGTAAGGSGLIARAGGAPAIVELLEELLPSWRDGTAPALRAEVLEHVEVISVALGVLINLASTEPEVCRQLTGPRPPDRGAGAGAGPRALPLLCRMLGATAEGVAAGAGGGAVGGRKACAVGLAGSPPTFQRGDPCGRAAQGRRRQRRRRAGGSDGAHDDHGAEDMGEDEKDNDYKDDDDEDEGGPELQQDPPGWEPLLAAAPDSPTRSPRPPPPSQGPRPAGGTPGSGGQRGARPQQGAAAEGSQGEEEWEAAGGNGEEDDARAGEAAIVEAYCAILLGFLLRGSPCLQRAATDLLSGGGEAGPGGLSAVVAAIRRCLSFYITAGAITEGTRDKLVALIAELEGGVGAPPPSAASSGPGGGGSRDRGAGASSGG